MAKVVNKRELGEILGVSDTALTEWQRDNMPVIERGGPGVSGRYDTEAVINWMIERALARVARETPKDRLDRVTAELRELELGKRRGELVEMRGVQRSLGAFLIELRTRLLAIPAAPEVPEELRAALDARIRQSLQDIADYDPALLIAAE